MKLWMWGRKIYVSVHIYIMYIFCFKLVSSTKIIIFELNRTIMCNKVLPDPTKYLTLVYSQWHEHKISASWSTRLVHVVYILCILTLGILCMHTNRDKTCFGYCIKHEVSLQATKITKSSASQSAVKLDYETNIPGNLLRFGTLLYVGS